MHLTPELVEAAYELVRQSRPFRAWKLPEADDLEFRVTRHNDRYAHFEYDVGKYPNISVSERFVKTLPQLLEVLMHEAIHVYQWKAGRASKHAQHNADFKRIAKRVCAAHGFDPKTF